MLEKMHIFLEFVIFCKNLICKSAILKSLYGRGFKATVKKQKASAEESVVFESFFDGLSHKHFTSGLLTHFNAQQPTLAII